MVASEVKAVPPVVSPIQDIPLAKIRESKTNPRRFFDEGKLAELADKRLSYRSSIYLYFAKVFFVERRLGTSVTCKRRAEIFSTSVSSVRVTRPLASNPLARDESVIFFRES
jgi:hypothetical protein